MSHRTRAAGDVSTTESDSGVLTGNVILVGLPRSGTSWLADLLSKLTGFRQVYEPDNEKLNPIAFYCKRDLHRFPYLVESDSAPAFEDLWTLAASDSWPDESSLIYRRLKNWFRRHSIPSVERQIGEKTGLVYTDERWNDVQRDSEPYRMSDHPIVAALVRRYLSGASRNPESPPNLIKSVHAPLALDWIAARLDAQLLVLLRNPFALYASYFRKRYPDGARNLLFQDRVRHHLYERGFEPADARLSPPELSVALETLIAYRILADQIPTRPDWIIASHDRLCAELGSGLRRIKRRLPFLWREWTASDVDSMSQSSDDRGARPLLWKQQLSRKEYFRIREFIELLELDSFLVEHVYSDHFDYSLA